MQCPICSTKIIPQGVAIQRGSWVTISCSNCGTEMKIPEKPGLKVVLREAVRCENNILAIKCIRALTDTGLRDAKDILWAILDRE